MNGYTSNPYTDRRYGPYLSATQGFLNSYRQYMREASQMESALVDRQYRKSLTELSRLRTEIGREHPELLFGRGKTEVSVNVPGKYQFAGALKRAGLTPSLIGESIANIPDYYNREQAQEFTEAYSLAGALAQKHFPQKGFFSGWGSYDYPQETVAPVFQEYLKSRDYWNKTPEQQEAIKDAWSTALTSVGGEEDAEHRGEIEFDWDNPRYAEILGGKQPEPSIFTKPEGQAVAPKSKALTFQSAQSKAIDWLGKRGGPVNPITGQMRRVWSYRTPEHSGTRTTTGKVLLTDSGVRSLLEEAGGDRNEARRLAKQRGWIIPQ